MNITLTAAIAIFLLAICSCTCIGQHVHKKRIIYNVDPIFGDSSILNVKFVYKTNKEGILSLIYETVLGEIIVFKQMLAKYLDNSAQNDFDDYILSGHLIDFTQPITRWVLLEIHDDIRIFKIKSDNDPLILKINLSF